MEGSCASVRVLVETIYRSYFHVSVVIGAARPRLQWARRSDQIDHVPNNGKSLV